jgi:hypothetical protein
MDKVNKMTVTNNQLPRSLENPFNEAEENLYL